MRIKKNSPVIFLFILIFALVGIGSSYLFRHNANTELPGNGNLAVLDTKRNENLALGRQVTVSSSADLGSVLVDGQELPNVSWHTSWVPPQSPSRPSWAMIDLGKTQSIRRLVIVFSIAAFNGIYDVWAPPNTISIEVGDSSDKTHPIEFISSDKIPENGACPDTRRLEVDLKKDYQARYVKLVFPTGGKLAAMPDVVGLGEIAVYGPDRVPQKREGISLESDFGRIIVDVNSPQIINFFLREPNGALAHKDILSGDPRGLTLAEARDRKIYYRHGAYTYVSDKEGHRFESYRSHSHLIKTETNSTGEITKIILTGIRPQSESGILGPIEEDWILESTSEGALSWTITQRWLKKFNVDISGTPALYLARFGGWGAFRDRRVDPVDPQITSTIWYDPAHIKSGTHPDYETYVTPMITEYRTHILDIPDTWAVYKLFTNFHLNSDLLLSVKGGYLFRRAGGRNDFNEIGATIEDKHQFERNPGDKNTLVLTLSPNDKFKSGQQFSIEIPDQTLAAELQDLHTSMLNGGVISDPKRYDFGNGTEDANYAGSADFQARALSVSIDRGMLAEYPYNADDAFKGHLERILETVNEQGLTCFGFNSACKLIDDNLHVISAAKTYVIKTGNRKFVERHYLTLERMINFFISHLDKSNGLFRSPEDGAHWYYDGINFSGFNTYYQAFLYQALLDLAEMSDLLNKKEKAASYRKQAELLAQNINSFLWFPDAPGGPRYADWIDDKGIKASYFIDIAQYPLIAFGIAPHERAKAMLETADKRLSELKEKFGYTRTASLSLLWPLSPERGERCFGTYFYGGSLLASTYWEILARARMGDVDGEWGAYRLLQNFAKGFAKTSFVGSNSIDIRGNTSLGGDEGYLSDMLVVPAALAHGLLGVETNWKEIKVTPSMPARWRDAKMSLMWKGRMYDIIIHENNIKIVPQQ